MRVMLDAENDEAFIQLKDVWEANPGGGSNLFLPPSLPFKIEVSFDEHERLELIRIQEASRRLHPDALKLAVPFEPYPPMPPGWGTTG